MLTYHHERDSSETQLSSDTHDVNDGKDQGEDVEAWLLGVNAMSTRLKQQQTG